GLSSFYTGKVAHQKEIAQGVGTLRHATKFEGQDYEALRKQCLEAGTLFEDDKFPAWGRSLGYAKFGPNSPKSRGVVWKRPTELCAKPTFIQGGATRTDICQGALGDCWLLAAIAALTLEPKILARVVPPGQSFDEGYAGIFHFQFWQFGEWVDVVVDDRLPTRNGQLLFVHSATRSEFWSALLEKAYAKVNGCYETLSGGHTIEACEDFTGGIAEMNDLESVPENFFKYVQRALKRDSLMGCSINAMSRAQSESVMATRLVTGHAYSVTGAEVVQVDGKDVELIRIRNPWGKIEWNGAWSDRSKEWSTISDEDRAKLKHASEDGEFWMSYSDFKQYFSRLDICNLTPDELDTDEKCHWNNDQCHGVWKEGSTAGGCCNYPTYYTNPQFKVCLTEEDDDPLEALTGGCTLVVGLMQKDARRARMQSATQRYAPICFTVYEYHDQTNVHLSREELQRLRRVEMSAFINTREVVERFSLPRGEYLIVPCTFMPRNGSFVLRIFTEKEAPTSGMDDDIDANVGEDDDVEGGMDPRFKQVFEQIAGNDSEVSVYELIRFLNQIVSEKQDVKTDGFSVETGRHIVSLLDQDGSAKLGLTEFHILWTKIQKYMEVFMNHDSDRTGTMSSHELREALTEAGFKVNNTVFEVLVDHYADVRCGIDFDGFVDCLVRLEMLFKMFKTLDTDGSGKIEMNIQQWLCLSLV
ncbi:calpain-2 catalytic subunit-like, partial [Engraulis encrasicolus]|uniref:calpain-2 catalytic subunit-like n=1 Tax=Engraulis encrasicolus TaxID=184585 RepID=UPI002FCFA2F0